MRSLDLPTRGSQLAARLEFAISLTTAYARDYNMPNIIMFSGTFVWSKKVAFYDPTTQRRYTFKIGNFVQLRYGNSGILRIDQILVHTFEGRQRLFVMGTPLPATGADLEDSVLGRGYRHIRLNTTPKPALFGLPSLSAAYMYVVPVQHNDDDSISLASGTDALSATEFIWSQNNLQWL